MLENVSFRDEEVQMIGNETIIDEKITMIAEQ